MENGKADAATKSRLGVGLATLIAAVVSFAAVYVSLTGADNGSPSAPASGPSVAGVAATVSSGAEDAAGSEFAGFVFKRPPADLAAITFTDEAGKPLTLADFKGKVVVLNLWATWCAPCRKEMPSLDRLQKDLGSDTFEVVALSLDRAGVSAARKFFDEIKVENLKLYIDSSMKAGNALRALGMPTTILIGKDGRELGRLPGPAEWDTATAKALIAEATR